MKKTLHYLLLLIGFYANAQDFWTEVSALPDSNFRPNQISMPTENVVWISSYDSTNSVAPKWSRSINAGQTWVSGDITLGSTHLKISSLFAISETIAYVSVFSDNPSVSGGVWVTHDSGITWTQQTSALFNGSDSFANFIHFFDANNGIVGGDPRGGYFELYTTSDAGNTWTRVPQTNIPASTAGEYGHNFDFKARGNSLWFGTNAGNLYISNDNGLTWAMSPAPANALGDDSHSFTFAFKNDNEGIMVSDGWYSYETADSGTNWIADQPVLVPHNRGLAYVPGTNNTYYNWGIIIDLNEPFGHSYSTDGRANWTELGFEQPLEIQTAKFYSGTVGYCIAREFDLINLVYSPWKVYKLNDPLNRLSTAAVTSGSAFNAVPNPTTGIVRISGEAITAISVCDISGKTVQQNQYDTLNEATLDFSSLQNGIYFVQIKNKTGATNNIKILKM